MADEVTVQMAVAPVAADLVTEPPRAEAELAANTPDPDAAKYDQLRADIMRQEADVKKKLAEVAKASEKKIRSPKIDEAKSVVLAVLPGAPNQALRMSHLKTAFGTNYTDDEIQQALKELIEPGHILTYEGWYWRSRDARG